ncbi:response regulator transcription factor [Endozoicomonas sp. SM1973]|uniref:Response regulator transcription factor n=1 Tax=Spartinivicinus marinus TaxID=2994442 RepID=A0A853IBA4_9GAMM|nr:response regulator transcription factor [Spartinivicinus marinus]MCX4026251.1 response regulator transcription factor [Spartinivicinus marinus]NYZ67334.1 response regulator transcription factor [Spartinivicinus marinus]
MLTVLLVEDDRDLADTVIQYLELENIRCDYASNGIAGLELVSQNHYDALLLDLNLPRLDGLAVCQRVRASGDDTPVLMLTARDKISDKLLGFDAGTDDYLVKPFAIQELVVRVRALAKRRSGQVRMLSCGDLQMDLTTKTLTRQGLPIKLSPTCWTLLETLLRASPSVVSRQQLEQALWGDEIPDSNSLKVHLFHLRKAIDMPFDTPLLHTIARQGFAIKADNG